MEQGILFSKAEKSTKEYCKSFCFANASKSAFWDRERLFGRTGKMVTRKEAQLYDEAMEKIIS